MSDILLIGTVRSPGVPTQKQASIAGADGCFAALMAHDEVGESVESGAGGLTDLVCDAKEQETLAQNVKESAGKEEDPENIAVEDEIVVDDLAAVLAPVQSGDGQPENDLETAILGSGQPSATRSVVTLAFLGPDGKYSGVSRPAASAHIGEPSGARVIAVGDAAADIQVSQVASRLAGRNLFLLPEKMNVAGVPIEPTCTEAETGAITQEVADSGVRFADSLPRSVHQSAQPGQQRVEVLRQITQAFVTAKENQVEIALSPEELGKLQLTIRRDDLGAHVFVWAERPETLDLIRRNSGLLMREFHDQGISDAEFSFGSGGAGAGSSGQWGSREPAGDTFSAPPQAGPDLKIQPLQYRVMRSGLDIRV